MLVRLVGVLTGRGSVSQLQLENAVLRHQVKVLRRTVRRAFCCDERLKVDQYPNFHSWSGTEFVHLALHNTNLNPLVEGPALMLAPVHGKVRRTGYRKAPRPA